MASTFFDNAIAILKQIIKDSRPPQKHFASIFNLSNLLPQEKMAEELRSLLRREVEWTRAQKRTFLTWRLLRPPLLPSSWKVRSRQPSVISLKPLRLSVHSMIHRLFTA
ncbi:hypothetical protein GOP47_0026180 [Adiantum capillus-veneris]|uniref:Uncharacterized protein n=1 Tax=Adiantum capillus-veneris TaxID=13818 RepID=A0A9D4Z4V8_ADICA|nr:hypothetical protein GOP47_0026180 [Adiantum capillus-veneris]